MTNTPDSATSLTLLGRLRAEPSDAATWDEFVARYGGKIEQWCRQWGLQPADAEDVTQNVLLALSKQMRTFEYRASGRFRSWLKTVSRRAWIDCLEARRRQAIGSGGDAIQEMLASLEAREDFLSRIEEECDRNILEDAMKLVEQRVQSHTWRAFTMTAIDRRSGQEVAVELEMTVLAVYRARSRVQAMLQAEVARLDGDE